MNLQRLFIVAACFLSLSVQATTKSRTLQYHPEGRDIVCVNGTNRYTRALYGGYTDFRVETSDRPIFGTYRGENHRNIRFRMTLNGKTIHLENTARCEARYNAGMRTYKLTLPRWRCPTGKQASGSSSQKDCLLTQRWSVLSAIPK